MKFRTLSLLLLTFSGLLSQNNYPKTYFKKPLDIPMYLAGTFGELRSNHFHSGIDIKTQHQEGLSVYASADGYVSRIKVSLWGYGKALYVTHPNGYTTVYAHLKKFNPRIEKYIKEKQYKKESFVIQDFPDKKDLLVKQGEVIAFSGNTGGSSAPHLHFEIRDKNSNPINPMLFGLNFEDDINPTISALVIYPLNDTSSVNGSNLPLQINISEKSNTEIIADKIQAYGKIGVGIKTFDRLNGALNKNGIYSMEMSLNGSKLYEHAVETFSFAESKYINLLIDYERYASLKQRIQRCFIVPQNNLSIYKNTINNGNLEIANGYNYNAKITVKDFNENAKNLHIPISGKKEKIKILKENKISNYPITLEENSEYNFNNTTVKFTKNTFYDKTYLDIEAKYDTITIEYKPIVVRKPFNIAFDTTGHQNLQQIYIARLVKGKPVYSATSKKDGRLITRTKNFGKYTLAYDSVSPTIKLSNFKDKQWMSNFKQLVVKIADKGTGIKNYKAEIDGKWILMEYNPRKRTLTYDFSDKKFTKAKHTLIVSVTDNVGNTNSISSTFYRKK